MICLDRKYRRTQLFIIDPADYTWAKFKAESLGFSSVSEYIFDLIKKDREVTESV